MNGSWTSDQDTLPFPAEAEKEHYPKIIFRSSVNRYQSAPEYRFLHDALAKLFSNQGLTVETIVFIYLFIFILFSAPAALQQFSVTVSL